SPPVVAGRNFEYETTPQNAAYWQALTLTYRQAMKKEADARGIDLRLLLDERRSGAFHCVGCAKPMVMRELFANGDRVYQCLYGFPCSVIAMATCGFFLTFLCLTRPTAVLMKM